jgi:hypothetical protein
LSSSRAFFFGMDSTARRSPQIPQTENRAGLPSPKGYHCPQSRVYAGRNSSKKRGTGEPSTMPPWRHSKASRERFRGLALLGSMEYHCVSSPVKRIGFVKDTIPKKSGVGRASTAYRDARSAGHAFAWHADWGRPVNKGNLPRCLRSACSSSSRQRAYTCPSPKRDVDKFPRPTTGFLAALLRLRQVVMSSGWASRCADKGAVPR